MHECAKVSHKRVFALLTPEIRGWEMAQMLQEPVFALPTDEREQPFVSYFGAGWQMLLHESLEFPDSRESRH